MLQSLKATPLIGEDCLIHPPWMSRIKTKRAQSQCALRPFVFQLRSGLLKSGAQTRQTHQSRAEQDDGGSAIRHLGVAGVEDIDMR
jgi:hypothetical protein